jgi:hypothetical protein
MREDFRGTRLQMMCQYFLFLLPNQRLYILNNMCVYIGVLIKSLARPGRKKATATEDFEFHISYL